MTTPVATVAATIAWLAAVGAFVYGCFAAASDVDGAAAFFVVGPAVLLLLAMAFFIARLALVASPRLSGTLSWASLGGIVFVLVFFGSAFVGPLSAFPEGVIDGVAAGYRAITGETPYAAAHRKPGQARR